MKKLNPKVAKVAANRLRSERSVHHSSGSAPYESRVHSIKRNNMTRTAKKHQHVNQRRLNNAKKTRMESINKATRARRAAMKELMLQEEMDETNQQLKEIYDQMAVLNKQASSNRSVSGTNTTRTRSGTRKGSRSGSRRASRTRSGSRRSSKSGSGSRRQV